MYHVLAKYIVCVLLNAIFNDIGKTYLEWLFRNVPQSLILKTINFFYFLKYYILQHHWVFIVLLLVFYSNRLSSYIFQIVIIMF